MKKQINNLGAIILLFTIMLTSCLGVAQETKRGKNILELGAGISTPNFTSTPDGQVYASSGTNVSFGYEREIITKQKDWFTLGVKYLTTSNPYNNLSTDTAMYNSSYSSYGVWSGTSDNYKLSSYLVGCGWYRSISKKDKFTLFTKLYLGSGSLTSPNQTLKATSGAFVTINELTKNSFVYTGSFGINYNFTNKLSLGVNVEYIKGEFLFENQQVSIYNGTQSATQNAPAYTISYSNLGLNTALSYKF